MKSLFSSLQALVKRRSVKKQKPLISHRHDLHVLQKVRGKRMPAMAQLRHFRKVLSFQERQMIRLAFFGLCIGIIWLGVDVTKTYRQAVPAVGGSYVEAVVGAPELINPLFASVNDVDVDLARLIYSGLMRYDEHQQLLPDLAESYVLSEDKKEYTFTLRQGVTWHDGTPFTAKDVKLTFDLIQDEQVGSPLFVSFQGVDITVVDPYTITFALEEPFQPFLSSLTVGILPSHIWADVPYEKLRLTKQNIRPIGTGPFKFEKLAKDETGFIFRYELARNAAYHIQPPYIETVAFQFFGDYETDLGAIQALRQQKVDGLHFVPSDLRDRVERKHINIHTLQLPQYTALFYNQKRAEFLAETDVRNALSYALDKERILRESLRDDGAVIYSPVLPGFPGYNSDVEKTPYDVAAANELLDDHWDRVDADTYVAKRREALLKELTEQYGTATSTEDGVAITSSTLATLEDAVDIELREEINPAQLFYRETDDEIIEIRLVTADTAEYRQAAGLIAGFWQELGVKTDIRFVPPRDISREILRGRKYDVLLYGIIVGSDPDQYPFWHSSQVEYPGLNLSQYVNRKVDELLEKSRETDSTEELTAVYTELQDILLKDAPATFLHTPIYRYATTNKVKGFTTTRIFHPSDRFSGVTNWYVKTKGDWGKK